MSTLSAIGTNISVASGGTMLWPNYWTDPDTGLHVRSGQIGNQFVIQAELTVTGFAGTEDVDYETIEANAFVLGAGCRVREGVRSGYYVVDAELLEGGFSGAEGVGWSNINGAY